MNVRDEREGRDGKEGMMQEGRETKG